MVSLINKTKNILNEDFQRFKFLIQNEKLSILLLKGIKHYLSLFKNVFFLPLKIKVLKCIYRRKDRKSLMINIGGGEFFRNHWRVLDTITKHYSYYKSFYIDYDFNLVSNKPLPFKDNSVLFFYSSHTLEHIPQENCQNILNEIFRCLRKDGAFRLTLPDYDMAYEAYIKGEKDFFKVEGNMEEKFLDFFATYLLTQISLEEFKKNAKLMKKEELADFYIKKVPIESQKNNAGNHVNWWNYKKAEDMLKLAGFSNIYQSKPQGSKFKVMRGEGTKTGFDSTHPKISFFIEAVK